MYGAVTAWFMGTRNSSKSWAAMICVHAARVAGFKKCCLHSGTFDGSERSYYFRK
jgi:hypothetical protein